MPDYRAETTHEPKLQAWLHPDEPGWRLVIEYVDETIRYEPIRSTCEPTLHEALRHMDLYWPEFPEWRCLETGQSVDVGGPVGYVWQKKERSA
jgi:hypothetical protein